MLTIAVNGRAVIVSQEFEMALSRYASVNFRQGATKKKDAALLPALRKEERQAWQDIYTELAQMMTEYGDEQARRIRTAREEN